MADRIDPLRAFRFKISFGAEAVALVSKMSPLKTSIEVVKWREGGDNNTQRKLVGATSYEAVTFDQGLVVDNATFQDWVSQVNSLGTDNLATAPYRKTVKVDVLDIDSADPVESYELYDAWPSEYQSLPEFDANGNSVAIKTLKVEIEGWKKTA